MVLKPLRNTDWSFPTLCYVCDPDNERGLRVQFSHDTEANRVVAEIALDKQFSGAPNYVHGGAVAAILDEAMGWACIALIERFGVTRKSEYSYKKPIQVGRPYRVEAWIVDQDERRVTVRADIRDEAGELMTEAEGRYWVMTAEYAQKALGGLSSTEKTFVQE
jgi:acyl-coenzyme A thioesterase PaaI-like protein